MGNTPAPPPTSQPGFHLPLLLPLVGVPSSVSPQTPCPHTGPAGLWGIVSFSPMCQAHACCSLQLSSTPQPPYK